MRMRGRKVVIANDLNISLMLFFVKNFERMMCMLSAVVDHKNSQNFTCKFQVKIDCEECLASAKEKTKEILNILENRN